MTLPIEVAEKYVDGLKPGSGDNYLGYCPIHGEVPGQSKPSFSFNAATGQWYCFTGCGGGGLPQFLRLMGVARLRIDKTMERVRPNLKRGKSKKVRVTDPKLFRTTFPLPERILGLYDLCPEELIESGFDEDVLFENDIGFDEKRSRITFPVRDLDGELAGIVGRNTDGSFNKYKVYVSEIEDLGFRGYKFENHDYLWRWDKIHPQIQGADQRPTICLTEGFKACLWQVQCGLPLTGALMGTKLGDVVKTYLERLGGRIVLCLDNDKWGRIATAKIGHKLRGLDVAVLPYPEETDGWQPDDLDPEYLLKAVASATPYSYWRKTNAKTINGTSTQRTRREKEERRRRLAR